MAALELLKRLGTASAVSIAQRTGLPLEEVYVQLVKAEAQGKARVVVDSTYTTCSTAIKQWEAM
jgi:predicted Rossmann fold nucleotide-binding protein DprA/Smf involved in DNA uptake